MKNQTAEKKRIKLILTGVFLGLGILLGAAARMVPGFGQWYSTHIYPILVGVIGRAAGLAPFSVSEILLYIVLLLLLGSLARLEVARRGLVCVGYAAWSWRGRFCFSFI